MRVAIVSKANRHGGGASRVAEDLAVWLNQSGHTADHFISFFQGKALGFQRSLYGEDLSFKLCKKIHSVTSRFGFPELLPVEYWFSLGKILDEYDVIHFHDLYTAISPLTLALVSQRKPTFFTVHDCSAFTGGCLYPMGCDKFSSYCHQCPQLAQNTWKARLRDHTRELQSLKRWVTKNYQIRYIFPSEWMAQQARLALTFKLPPLVIPYGLDLQTFSCLNKRESKAKLGIPENRSVIAISAYSLNDERKGIGYALEAVKSVADLSPIVVTVGHCNDDVRQALRGLEVKEIGFISDPKVMAQVYCASDILLFCSLADNLPLTVLEAMAGSTVIVGFSTGGVPEMIKTKHNGILVEPTNQEALNQALRQALLSTDLLEMGSQARRDLETKFSHTIFLERHLQIYQEVI
jgi:glycosyltransferase involved in cell wall biosynthesis